jgi:hypothetical protein
MPAQLAGARAERAYESAPASGISFWQAFSRTSTPRRDGGFRGYAPSKGGKSTALSRTSAGAPAISGRSLALADAGRQRRHRRRFFLCLSATDLRPLLAGLRVTTVLQAIGTIKTQVPGVVTRVGEQAIRAGRWARGSQPTTVKADPACPGDGQVPTVKNPGDHVTSRATSRSSFTKRSYSRALLSSSGTRNRYDG